MSSRPAALGTAADRRGRRPLLAALLTAALVACGNGGATADQGEPAPPRADAADLDDLEFERLEGLTTNTAYPAREDSFDSWRSELPAVEDVRIVSSVDGEEQPALWLPPSGEGAQPLLVVLHSWSTRYLQQGNVPFGQFAEQQGWAMIAPDFRGVFETPEATGSDTAVQDVVDAIDWAVERAEQDADGIEERRVFVLGFSGGAMMSLLMAGRHPDRVAAAVSWVGIDDLVDWYAYNAEAFPGRDYVRQIEASCGGVPTADPQARASCEQRSPAAHLDAAREAGVPVYLGHGLSDDVVPPVHSVRAFNALADEGDRLPAEVVRATERGELPDELVGSTPARAYFGEDDPEVLLTRSSGATTLVLFEGEHDMVYNPGLEWLTEVG